MFDRIEKESILSQSKAVNFQNFPRDCGRGPPGKEFSGSHCSPENFLGSYLAMNGNYLAGKNVC